MALASATAAGQALSASPPHQVVTGPVAVYWMSASTTSGFGMGGGGGGGGRPDSRAMMAMALGRGPDTNSANHSLILQLGSSRTPQGGPPAAEHDPPEGLGAGPVLPLATPHPQAAPAYQEQEAGPPPQYRQPHGRMLIFWGCGEHAGPGQPYVIDFANAAAGGGGTQFMALTRGLNVAPMQPPSPTRNTTYGEWPNQESRTQLGPNASLRGAHVVKGDYSPEMHFALDANQDFLPPFQLTANEKMASGANNLAWRPIDGAKGYYATMIGGQGRGQDEAEVVMWTSSAAQASAFGLPDYLSNHEIERLTAQHVLMPAEQTQCAIPAEAVAAVGRGGFFNLIGYGGESNLSWPPRPPAPQPWNIAWEVKLRYRAQTSGIVGMDMARMMGGRGGGGSGEPDSPQRPPPKRHGLLPPLGLPHSPFP
jgi:hypothetical protein